jgi:hypothetical protein
MTATPTRTLRARSARYRSLITWVVAGVVVLQLLQHFGPYLVQPFDWDRVRVSLILLVPHACYLYGVWSLRPAFNEIAEGRMFGVAQAKALTTLGWSLIVGGAFSVLLLHYLLRLSGVAHAGYLNFDLSDIVLAVVGGALVLLSHLMAKAHAMKSELDDII